MRDVLGAYREGKCKTCFVHVLVCIVTMININIHNFILLFPKLDVNDNNTN